MFEDKTSRIIELIDMMLDAIGVVRFRTAHIKSADDYLLSPDNMFILDGVCMKLIFIGESIKTIDRLSAGKLFPLFPAIPWKEIMKLRDIIAHHYFQIDVDVVYSTIQEDLQPLQKTLMQMRRILADNGFQTISWLLKSPVSGKILNTSNGKSNECVYHISFCLTSLMALISFRIIFGSDCISASSLTLRNA